MAENPDRDGGRDETEEERLGAECIVPADEWVTGSTSSADVDNSKPSPDLVDAALAASGLDADQTVFVGDAVWDVIAAAKVGVSCIGLTCGGTSEAELRDAGAAAVYVDPADLLGTFPFVRS